MNYLKASSVFHVVIRVSENVIYFGNNRTFLKSKNYLCKKIQFGKMRKKKKKLIGKLHFLICIHIR